MKFVGFGDRTAFDDAKIKLRSHFDVGVLSFLYDKPDHFVFCCAPVFDEKVKRDLLYIEKVVSRLLGKKIYFEPYD